MKKIGIVIVCTNAYFILGLRFVKKFMKHYTGNSIIQFYLFTDTDPRPYAPNLTIHYVHTTHANWQDGTNSKFRNILQLQNEDCDYIYYFDADTNISRNFTEDWFLGDLVGGEHYNNSDKNKDGTPAAKPYDRNPASRAYIPNDTTLPQMYYYGAFFGGLKDRVLDFCRTNYENQHADKAIHYEPCWNDESYINHYFHFTPPTVVPSAKFAFVISDKGGIGETRATSLNIENYKKQVLRNPEAVFDFQNQTVYFDQVRQSIHVQCIPLDIMSLPILVMGSDSQRLRNVLSGFSTQRSFLTKEDFRNLLHSFCTVPESFTPHIVLHDCVSVNSLNLIPDSCPIDTDCLYLGISRFSAAPGFDNYQEGVEYVPVNDTMVKITNMLSLHAYSIMSLKWVEVLLHSLNIADEKELTHDLLVASNMKTHNVYALRNPVFYQDGIVGGQEGPTNVTFDTILRI